jgi:hypothetical protein
MSKLNDFKNRFPDFDTNDAHKYVPILEPVLSCYYNGDYDNNACDKEISLNILAHLIVIERQSTPNANYKRASESVGSVSVSNAVNQPGSSLQENLGATKYGQRALQLMMTKNRGLLFV